MSTIEKKNIAGVEKVEEEEEEGIYLDYNATTPIADEVAAAMAPYLFNKSLFGNPSSSHPYGRRAKLAVEAARSQVAQLLGCSEEEVTFTSGGTESNNTAIKCTHPRYIITSAIEHPAVSEVCEWLHKNRGVEVTVLPVDSDGIISIESLETTLQSITNKISKHTDQNPNDILVTIMYANNEIGAIQPIPEIVKIAHKYGALVHSDAAQATGKISIDVNNGGGLAGVDMVSIAGHKLYAPKGIGALFVRKGIAQSRLGEKLMHGANHEQNRRAGTENVLEIVGLGKACEIAKRDLEKNILHMSKVRDILWNAIEAQIPNSQKRVKMNGSKDINRRLPNTLSVSFRGIHASTLLSEISDKVAASPGAACHSSTDGGGDGGDGISVSATLRAIGLPIEWAMGTVRLSVGRETTEEEVKKAADIICNTVRKLQHSVVFDEDEDNDENDYACEIGNENIDPENVRLTQYTHGMGCACKLRPKLLEKVLSSIPIMETCKLNPNILVSVESSDDACVYKLNDDLALVMTLDFFTPICDNPYDFGAIAAANALSDVYAMGGKPLTALSICAFPQGRLPLSVLECILKGALDKCIEAGIAITGGHTVEDTEPKFGLSVVGTINPKKILKNNGIRKNDVLILTKAIGVGILSTALKRKLIDKFSPEYKNAISLMSTLNKKAAEAIADTEIPEGAIHACTDVTGFGLLGHLKEMVLSAESPLTAHVDAAKVPVISGVRQLVVAGAVPGATGANLDHAGSGGVTLKFGEEVSQVDKSILADPQTSGGLLFAVDEKCVDTVVKILGKYGVKDSAVIGRVAASDDGSRKIIVN